MSASLVVLTSTFLCGPPVTSVRAAAPAQAQPRGASRPDASAQKQVTDFAAWKSDEASRTALRRQQGLAALRVHSGAEAQQRKAKAAQETAEEIERARPTAKAERALAKARLLGLSTVQQQAALAAADAPLAAQLKTRKPPLVQPGEKPGLMPASMAPTRLPRLTPRVPPQRGGLPPGPQALYPFVAGKGLLDDEFSRVEEALSELSVPVLVPRRASLPGDASSVAPVSAMPTPTPDDLQETPETRRSPDLLALVARLGNRPLDLYNFVHTQVTPQLYYGSKKGAAQTLVELSGNDFDQASLLVAMLRAAGHPARYEYGTVSLSAAQALALTGAKDIASAAIMLSRTGPAVLAPDGTSISAERAWVRAFVPYGMARGTEASAQKLWVRLDPGMKETKYTPAVSLKGLVHFDFDAFLAQPTTKTPLDVFEEKLLAAAKAKNLCNTLDDALSRVVVTQPAFDLLPAEHPSPVLQSLSVFARPPETFRYMVDVTLDGATTQLELAELEGRALSLTYPGTTPQDADVIATAGSIARVAPQRVSVTPTLTMDGQTKASFAPTNPGTAQKLVLHVTVPGGNLVLGVHHLVAGTPYAVLVEGGAPSAAQLTARMQAATNATGEAQWLARAQAAVAQYARQLDVAYTRLFNLQGQGTIKDVTLAVAGKQLRVTSFLELPVAVAEGSYVIDVSRDSLSPLARDGDDSMHTELGRWAGWQGSTTEGRAWEAVLGGPGMSSVKALQVATAQGVPVLQVNAANRSQLSGYSADSLADIDNALAAGWTATVPQHPVNLGRFQNVEGYILENPVNGEGVFRLGSSLNGGEGEEVATAGALNSPAGCAQCTKSVVMLNDGNWRESRTDLTLPAIGLPIVFSRTYASQATALTPLGYGWIHSYGMFLRSESNGDFTYVTDDWHEVRFTRVGAAYQAAPGWHFTLTDTAGGGHAMRDKQGMVWEFDSTGAVTRISEPSGNATTLVYSGDKLIQVQDSSGQVALTLSYTGNKLTSVLDRAGRIVRFGYTNDDLTAATDVLDHTETYGYDNTHNLTSRTDKRGQQYLEFYDLQDRWVGYRDPLGHEVSVAYDFVNSRAVFTDRTGATWTTEFNAAGNPTVRVDPLGNRTEMIWDADSNPVSSKDARGFVTVMTYDSQGNQRTRTDPDGRVVDIGYDATFSMATRIDATGLPRVSTVLDAAGRPASRTDGLGTTTFGYDAQGQLLAVTAPGSAVTTFGHDSQGNITSITDPTSRVASMGYDPAGHLTSSTDGNGHTRTMTVDAAGRVTASRTALNEKTEFTHDDEGHRLTAKDPTGSVMRFEYDALGNLAKMTDALGFTTRIEYDAEERPIATIDARGNRMEMKYDAAGRVAETRSADGAVSSQAWCADVGQACGRMDPLGHVSTTEFDKVGRAIRETDPLGRVTTTTYDSAGRVFTTDGPHQPPLVHIHDAGTGLLTLVRNPALGLDTEYGYDARGNRTSITTTNSGRPTTRYTYDQANRLLTEINPLGTVTTYTYDTAGNRETKLDGNGQTTRYRYDDNRRLTTVEFSDGTKYEYAYDSQGNRTLEKNANHERQLTFDARNRVSTVVDVTFGKTLTYAYDANGNRVSLTEGATTFGYAYDAMNRLKQADAFGGSIFFEYDAAGRRTSLLRPNGIRTTWAYDDGSQVTSITHARGDNVVLGFTYEYDFHGMRTSKTREDGTKEVYGYDAADRLVQVDYGSSRRVQYGLDPLGNRGLEDTTSPGQPLVRDGGTFNDFNQLMTTGGPGSTFPLTDFAYDLNGNLIAETRHPSGLPDEVTAYSWDRDNRLRSVTLPIAALTVYGYDVNGLRTHRIDPTGTTRYLLDNSRVIEELDGANTANIKYLNNPQQIEDVIAYQRGGQIEYPLADALDSLYAATDASGNVVHRYDYDVYGKRTDVGGSALAVDTGYTGHRHDADMVIDGGDRIYLARWARFLEPDRLGVIAGVNLYGYAANRPTMFIDPLGFNPGDPFWTWGEAVFDALRYTKRLVDDSTRKGAPIEYAGAVYRGYSGYYTYEMPTPGENAWTSDPRNNPSWSTAVAYFHGHPDARAKYPLLGTPEELSDDDRKYSERKHIPMFMVTPTGVVKAYFPNNAFTAFFEVFQGSEVDYGWTCP